MDPKINLVIVDGGTPPRIKSKDLIERFQLHDRVHITGQVTQEELVKWYSSAEVAVVPSLYEGFGFPAAEAMACELPVVATTAGALPEVIGANNETGVLVPSRKPEALAEAIESLLADPARRCKIGRKARERVLDVFTWKNSVEKLEEVYREVIRAYG
jgi:glycosyltransferase involved in cell wall biosynthesis